MSKKSKKGRKKSRDGKRETARKPKKDSRKKPRPASEEGGRRKYALLAIIVVVIVIIAIISWYIFGVYIPGQDGNGIDRSIKFPRDEGSHDEPYEFWRVIFLLSSTGGDEFGISVTYNTYSEAFGGGSDRLLLITDEGNVSGIQYYSKRDVGETTSEKGRLDISYDGSSALEHDTWTQLEGFNYTYHAELRNATTTLAIIDLSLDYFKPPILIGENGKIFDAELNFGTIYGYSQTRLVAQGTLVLRGTTHSVQGLAWVNHQWGGWTYTNKEYWQFQLKNGEDIEIFRFYNADTLLYEHFYVVDVNGIVTSKEDFDVFDLKYLIAPADPLEKRCVSSKWKMVTTELDLNADPTVLYQFSAAWGWEGTIDGSGMESGSFVEGRGYATIEKTGLSTLTINNVNHDFPDPFPPGTLVNANISDDIPIVNVTLRYNTSMDPTLKSVSMSFIGGYDWEGYIPGQPVTATVYYYIEAYDLADKYKKSEDKEFEYT